VLRRVDDAWLRVERAGVVLGSVVMAAVVFADVVHRVFADRSWQTPLRLAVTGAIVAALCMAALRTATAGRLGWPKAAGYGVALSLGLAALTWGFVWLVPAGVIWAQTLALVLMLWVGFLGASIATRQNKHLKVDAAERLFRGRAQRAVGAASNAIAALATLALGILAVNFCRYNYEVWVETEGAGGDFEGLPIPKFLAFAVLPLTFFTMTARFVAQAWLKAHGAAPLPPAPTAPAEPTPEVGA
jgi:TRAP-type C4-dicarboxylate transport system permease small subunit